MQIGRVQVAALFVTGLLAFAGFCANAAQQDAPRREFDVVSFKFSGQTIEDQQIYRNGVSVGSRTRQLEFKGNRLSGNIILYGYLEFAFPEVAIAHESLSGHSGYYQIEAIAPNGTTLDEARAMLRKVLVDRLHVQYHFEDRKTPVYHLLRGPGALRLKPSIEAQKPQIQSTFRFKSNAAKLDRLALFFQSITGKEVVDKTGIQGAYAFDIDIEKELQGEPDFQNARVSVAIAEASRLGLKLQPATAVKKYIVLDKVDKYPIAN